ncbi:ATP-grasp domain-containing protein [Sulfurimonas sp. SAG-AH-194-C20]|nr:ATP-grasp domain-containing protein [Sulfurimonas sp. SAG-AH-194-C20]MDF1878203.1 ATP-grasp domain-containing protein [Sulfurimonas sp. SAG-AH-194-C20]
MKKKALLILGASNDQLFLLQTAKNMGLQTVVVDANPNAVGLDEADYSQAIDFSKTQEVIAYVKQLISQGVMLSGVLTMGSDIPHLLAIIAQEFGWISPSFETANITTNKFLMKECFRENDIPIPNYALIENPDTILSYWEEWNTKSIIIKPVDAAGSRGVSICQDPTQIFTLYTHAKENSKTKQVIIEEFIEGSQISTETIVYNGRYAHPGFADRVYEDTLNFHPYIMENGGWQPSGLDASVQKEVCALLEKIAQAIKLKKGVIKGDIVYSTKYKKAMVIEVASRLSGGDFSASLVPLAHDINYVQTAIEIAINKTPNFKKLTKKTNYIVANRYFFIPQGKLEEIVGLAFIHNHPNIEKLEFNYSIGDIIPKIQNHGQRIGVFIVKAESREKVQDIINLVYERVTFIVDKKTHSGNPHFYKV